MKYKILLLLVCYSVSSMSQEQKEIYDSISGFFSEIKTATKEGESLWDKDIYGPILLVEPQTRQIYANQADSLGILKPRGSIYSGKLPDHINIANTAKAWGGKNWAMVMLPLPQNKRERIELLGHELFHRAQPLLGFTLNNPSNDHLDQKDGRIYLRLELEALKKALLSLSEKKTRKHLKAALKFRKYRHLLYPSSDSTENQLELNEGVAAYTGSMLSGRNDKMMQEHFLTGINEFYKNPTFVRSFAYHTIPIYGFLLHKKNEDWQKGLTSKTDITEFFIDAFNTNICDYSIQSIEKIANQYNGEIIVREEENREDKRKKIIADYRERFIEQPHFEIKFEQMNMTFDPRNIVPIEDKGTVYPNIRVTDLWGILEVQEGALMSPNWDKISLTNPTEIEGKKIVGDGWTLALTEDYSIVKDKTTGNFKLVKNSY